MRIPHVCPCGRRYQVKPELAGRVVKCPACGQRSRVPDSAADDPPAEDAGFGSDDPWGTPASPGAASPAGTCPNCFSAVPTGAVLCTSCGYHFEHRRKLTTVVERTAPDTASGTAASSRAAASYERTTVELPPGTTFERQPDQLVIRTRGTLYLETRWLVAFTAATTVLPFVVSIPLLYVPVLQKFAWMPLVAAQILAIVAIAGRSILTVAKPALSITVTRREVTFHSPAFPWPLRDAVLPLDTVVQFYVFRKKHWPVRRSPMLFVPNRGYFTFHLNALQDTGWRRTLCCFYDEATAVAVEELLEQYLEMPEAPVVSTWYQRYLSSELTHGDVDTDEARRNALVGRSFPIPRRLFLSGLMIVSVLLLVSLLTTAKRVRELTKGDDERRTEMSAPKHLLDKPAPRAELQTMTGEKLTIPDDFAGKIVILEFWSTYSPVSQAKAPWLKEWGDKYGGRGVELYLVNLGEAPDLATNFARQQGWTGHVVRDHARQAIMTYRCIPTPNLFLLDRDGKIVAGYRGSDPRLKKLFEADVERLLAAPR